MHKLKVFSIIDLLHIAGEDTVNCIIKDFACYLNPEIEHFLKHNSVEFAKRKISITYFVFDEDDDLLGYFALTHKPITVYCQNLSNTIVKKINSFGKSSDCNESFDISAFLIAQFGKNLKNKNAIKIEGAKMMELAIDKLKEAQRIIGGGIVFIECEAKPKLLDFYKQNLFKEYGIRYSDKDNEKYIQMLRLF